MGSGLKIPESVWKYLARMRVPINKAVEEGLRILARNPSRVYVLMREQQRGPYVFTRASISRDADIVAEQLAQALGLSKHAVLNAAVLAYVKALMAKI